VKVFSLRWNELGMPDAVALAASVALVLTNVIAPTTASIDSLATLRNVPSGVLATIGGTLLLRMLSDFVLGLVRRSCKTVRYDPIHGPEMLAVVIVTAGAAWLYWPVAPTRDLWTLTTVFAFGGAMALISPLRQWRQRDHHQGI